MSIEIGDRVTIKEDSKLWGTLNYNDSYEVLSIIGDSIKVKDTEGLTWRYEKDEVFQLKSTKSDELDEIRLKAEKTIEEIKMIQEIEITQKHIDHAIKEQEKRIEKYLEFKKGQ